MPTNHNLVTHTEESDDDRNLRAAFYFVRKLTIISNPPPKLRIVDRLQRLISSTSPLFKEMLQLDHIADCNAIRDHVEHVLGRQDAQQLSWADLADILRIRYEDSACDKKSLRRKRGRPIDTDAAHDAKLVDAWRLSGCRAYAKAVRELSGRFPELTAKKLACAIDRHRHRARNRPSE